MSSKHNSPSPVDRDSNVPPTCSNQDWRLLLDDALPTQRAIELETHIENCSNCRTQLERYANQKPAWWEMAKDSWLEEELPKSRDPMSTLISIEIGRELPEDSPLEMERVSLSFLDAPSHPELLGRLGRYDVERVIGVGGMGVVLKAYDSELHRVVALKVLAQHLANNVSARKRFAREAQAAAAVLHPNVIPIYNVETDGTIPYLVMQCVNGCSVQNKVDRNGGLSIAETLRIAKQTAAGLASAHEQGLVHRDVKPANILLEENVDRVLLSDFGLARAVDDASLTRTGVVAGTPHYMSPEQARGEVIQFASDQFSLGSVMYFMLTGHPPFRAQNAMGVLNRICHDPHRPVDTVNSDVPHEVSELIDRMLQKSPSDRFASMVEVEKQIDQLLSALQRGGLSLRRPLPQPIAPESNKPSNRMALFPFYATLSLMLVSGLAWFGWQEYSQRLTGQTSTDLTVKEWSKAQGEWESARAEDGRWWAEMQSLERDIESLSLQWRMTPPPSVTIVDASLIKISEMELRIYVLQTALESDEWSMFESKSDSRGDDVPEEHEAD